MIPSRQDNPFATCWTKPGVLPFVFPEGKCVGDLIDRLKANHWWGQIIGPHGVGKSTLLASLIPALRDAGREPLLVELHDKQRRLLADFWQRDLALLDVVVVDGYEQLNWWQRWQLKRHCRRAECGLIVTTHSNAHLPLLVCLEPNLPTVQKLVLKLRENVPTAVTDAISGSYPISESDVSKSYRAHDGNVREIFFDLYDRHDRKLRQSRTSAALKP